MILLIQYSCVSQRPCPQGRFSISYIVNHGVIDEREREGQSSPDDGCHQARNGAALESSLFHHDPGIQKVPPSLCLKE